MRSCSAPCAARTAPTDARFCSSCGYSLVTGPTSAGSPRCSSPTSSASPPSPRPPTPSRSRPSIDQCFARLCNDVTAFGGRVDKIVGDAVVALFGAPVAHEDDAERAVRPRCGCRRPSPGSARERGDRRPAPGRREHRRGRRRRAAGRRRLHRPRRRREHRQPPPDRRRARARSSSARAPTRPPGTRSSYEHRGALDVKGREEPVEAWRAVDAIAPPGTAAPPHPHAAHRPRPEMALLRSIVDSAVAPHAARTSSSCRATRASARAASPARSRRRASQRHDATRPRRPVRPVRRRRVVADRGGVRGACGLGADDSARRARRSSTDAVVTATGHLRRHGDDRARRQRLLYLLGHVGRPRRRRPRPRPRRLRSSARILLPAHRPRPAARPRALRAAVGRRARAAHGRATARSASRAAVHRARHGAARARRRWRLATRARQPHRSGMEPLDAASVARAGRRAARRRGRRPTRRRPARAQRRQPVLRRGARRHPARVGRRRRPDPLGFLDTGGLPVTLQGLVAARLDALGPGRARRARGLRRRRLERRRSTRSARSAARRVDAPTPTSLRDLLPSASSSTARRRRRVRVHVRGDPRRRLRDLTKGERARRHAVLADWLAARAPPSDDGNAPSNGSRTTTRPPPACCASSGTVEGVPADVEARRCRGHREGRRSRPATPRCGAALIASTTKRSPPPDRDHRRHPLAAPPRPGPRAGRAAGR